MTTANLANDNLIRPEEFAPRKKVQQIQENLIAYFRLSAGLPGMTFVDEENLIWMANQGSLGNLMLRTALFGAALDQQIDDIINQIGQRTTRFD